MNGGRVRSRIDGALSSIHESTRSDTRAALVSITLVSITGIMSTCAKTMRRMAGTGTYNSRRELMDVNWAGNPEAYARLDYERN